MYLKMDVDHVYLSSTGVLDGHCVRMCVVWRFNAEINVPPKDGETRDAKL